MPEWIYVTCQNDQEHNRPSGNSKWLNPSPATALSGKRPHSESPCKGVPLQCETWKLSTQPNYFSIAIPCNSTGSATKTKWQPSSEWKKTVALCTVSPCKHGSIRRSWRVLHFKLSTRTGRGNCHGHPLHRCHHGPHILPRHCCNTLSKVFLIRELESTGKYSSSIAGCITRSTPGLTLTSRVDARSGVRVADGASCSFKCMTYCLVLNSGQDKFCHCKLY